MQPRGIDLLATLIDLLADQEGVEITYELEDTSTGETLKRSSDRKVCVK